MSTMQQERVKPAQVPSVGRIVHYVLGDDTRNPGAHRPAIIVRVWGQSVNDRLNLQLFTDEQNDGFAGGTAWRTSVGFDPECGKGTWHWPEYVAPTDLPPAPPPATTGSAGAVQSLDV